MDRPLDAVAMADDSPTFKLYPVPLEDSASVDEQVSAQPESSGLLPFLGLKARLLLSALSPSLLPLILTTVHLAATRATTQELADKLHSGVYGSCAKLAQAAGSVQAFPRYLAMKTNEELLRNARSGILALGMILIYILTAIREIIIFVADMYRALLMCTIEFVINAAFDLIAAIVAIVVDAINKIMDEVMGVVQGIVGVAGKVANAGGGFINGLLDGFGQDKAVPTVEMPNLDHLRNFQLPTNIDEKINELHGNIPTLNELKDMMNDLIAIPFNLLIKEINDTSTEIAAALDTSLLPVPSLKSLGVADSAALNKTLCSDLDTSFIDDTAKSIYTLGTVALFVMIGLIVLGSCTLMFLEWRQWVALQGTVETIQEEWQQLPPGAPMNAWNTVAVVENPMVETFLEGVYSKLGLDPSPRARNNMRWLMSYLCHPTCLTLLFTSSTTLAVLGTEVIFLHVVTRKAKALAESSILSTASDISNRLSLLSLMASEAYAKEMNTALGKLEANINDKLFTNFIDKMASTLNNTLEQFYAGIENGVRNVLQNTPFLNAVDTFLYCVLGSKVDALQKALAWVEEHTHIDLPEVDPKILMFNDTIMKELTGPLAAAVLGDGKGNEGYITQISNHYLEALQLEIMIYAIVLAVWGLLFFIAIAAVIWHGGLSDKFSGTGHEESEQDQPRSSFWSREKEAVDDDDEEPRETKSGGAAFAKLRGFVQNPKRDEWDQPLDDDAPADGFWARNVGRLRGGEAQRDGGTTGGEGMWAKSMAKLRGRGEKNNEDDDEAERGQVDSSPFDDDDDRVNFGAPSAWDAPRRPPRPSTLEITPQSDGFPQKLSISPPRKISPKR